MSPDFDILKRFNLILGFHVNIVCHFIKLNRNLKKRNLGCNLVLFTADLLR